MAWRAEETSSSAIALPLIPHDAYANLQKLRADYPGVYTADGVLIGEFGLTLPDGFERVGDRLGLA